MCFRYGGDEFVVLMPDTAPADALALATEIASGTYEHKILHEQRPWN